jgi:hypothetical protein
MTSLLGAEELLLVLGTIPAKGNSMANLGTLVQQLRKERDQAAKEVERLEAALAALSDGAGRRNSSPCPR